MEEFTTLAEDGALFLIMSVFAVMKQMIAADEKIKWRLTFSKVFINLVAGIGFYSFLLSHRDWYANWPQKIGVIMLSVYVGSRLIDIIVDKFFKWIMDFDFKELLRRLFDL